MRANSDRRSSCSFWTSPTSRPRGTLSVRNGSVATGYRPAEHIMNAVQTSGTHHAPPDRCCEQWVECVSCIAGDVRSEVEAGHTGRSHPQAHVGHSAQSLLLSLPIITTTTECKMDGVTCVTCATCQTVHALCCHVRGAQWHTPCKCGGGRLLDGLTPTSA